MVIRIFVITLERSFLKKENILFKNDVGGTLSIIRGL